MRYINVDRARATRQEEVLVWYLVGFRGGPRDGEHQWFPGSVPPYHQVPGRNGGILSSQYQLVRVLVVEKWRSFYHYHYHFPHR